MSHPVQQPASDPAPSAGDRAPNTSAARFALALADRFASGSCDDIIDVAEHHRSGLAAAASSLLPGITAPGTALGGANSGGVRGGGVRRKKKDKSPSSGAHRRPVTSPPKGNSSKYRGVTRHRYACMIALLVVAPSVPPV